jgi:hypothetical protein
LRRKGFVQGVKGFLAREERGFLKQTIDFWGDSDLQGGHDRD